MHQAWWEPRPVIAPSPALHRTDTKGSIRTRRMKEAWGDNYLLTARKILTTK